jgi:hypothetical protein
MTDARHTPASGFDWESAEDLTSLPEPELRRLLARVAEEERAAAFRREVLRWRGDRLSSEDLARVLLGEEGSAW